MDLEGWNGGSTNKQVDLDGKNRGLNKQVDLEGWNGGLTDKHVDLEGWNGGLTKKQVDSEGWNGGLTSITCGFRGLKWWFNQHNRCI